MNVQIRVLKDAEAGLFANGDKRLPVERLLRGTRPSGHEPTVLVTHRDLALRGCESLFGYADRRRAMAVVSTFRLHEGDESRVSARLANVIEHERGHLAGLRHCKTPGCVMSPARAARDLDIRSLEPCERCRKPRKPWLPKAIAAAAALVVLAALQGTAGLVKVKTPPFSWRAHQDRAEVFYRSEPVLSLAGAAEASAAAATLNDLFARITPPPIETAGNGSGAVLRAGGAAFATVDRRTAGGEDPVRWAEAWSRRTNLLMRAKGTEAEGCPDCHIRRLPEVEAAERMRRQRRW